MPVWGRRLRESRRLSGGSGIEDPGPGPLRTFRAGRRR
jgi:hypothetical protein